VHAQRDFSYKKRIRTNEWSSRYKLGSADSHVELASRVEQSIRSVTVCFSVYIDSQFTVEGLRARTA